MRPERSGRRLRVALVADLREEGWASMDLVAEMLYQHLRDEQPDRLSVTLVRPPLRSRLGRLPGGGSPRARNVDRLLNRFVDYPRALRAGDPFDVYHVVDHSYAHLVHSLPAERTVVTCHDLDTFRCLLRPGQEPRSAAFRAMTGRILGGLRRAARVACVSAATRDELLAHGLVPPDRLEVVPNGVDALLTPRPDPAADEQARRLLGDAEATVDLLHVGSTIPRKRIDLLLRVFAAVREREPRARLVRAGGPLTAEQERLAGELGLGDAVLTLPFLERPVLAAVYRRAALALLPSDAEGFGLPLAEAMASGTVVVASDLPVLREVGGPAGVYRPVGAVEQWADAVSSLLLERRENPEGWERRRAEVAEAGGRFRWTESARRMAEIYTDLAPGT